MASTLFVPVEDVDEVLAGGTYTHLRVYHATQPDGSFTTQVSGSPTALVEGQTSYEVSDSTGVPGRWYRSRFANAGGSTISSLSEPWQVKGTTLRELLLETAMFAGAGTYGTAVSGTTTYLGDPALLDQGVDVKFLEGAWLKRPDAVEASDRIRRIGVSGFDDEDGGFTPRRAWTNAPDVGESYEAYLLLPPADQPGLAYSWSRAVRDALEHIYFEDEITLGTGPSSGVRQRRFSLKPFVGFVDREDVRRLVLRTFDTDGIPEDRDASKHLRWWDYGANGDDCWVELSHAPAETETVVAMVNTTYEVPYLDSDVSRVPPKLLAPAGAMKAYEYLNRISGGKYQAEWAFARSEFWSRYGGVQPEAVTSGP